MERLAMQELLKWKNARQRKPLLIQGARQVGKTYLLKEFGRRYFPRCHYVNFEKSSTLLDIFAKSLDPLEIIKELEFLLETEIDPKNDILIFDEIQREPRALTSLKYFCENMPETAICAAGSLLGVTMNIDSFPVGKVDMLDMRPLNFYEFLKALDEQKLAELLATHDIKKPFPVSAHEKLINIWKHYLVVGGLPEAVEYFRNNRDNVFNSFLKVRDIQEVLLRTYMADIAKHSGKINSVHIEQILKNVPAQLASSVDDSAKKFIFKDVIPGIRGYSRLSNPIGWLERANLILRVPVIDTATMPLTTQVKENVFKLYFFDVGLLGALSQLPPAVIMKYDFKTYKGFFAENFVLQELLASGISNTYCWQGRTSEIEFIIQTNEGEIIPIEVKSGAVTHSKSLSTYCKKYEPTYSIVISLKNEGKKQSRWYIPLYATEEIKTSRYFYSKT